MPWTRNSCYVYIAGMVRKCVVFLTLFRNTLRILTWTRRNVEGQLRALSWSKEFCSQMPSHPGPLCGKKVPFQTGLDKSRPSHRFFWPMSQVARCSHEKDFTFKYCHLQVVHLKMFTPPSATHTSRCAPPSVSLFTQYLWSTHTHTGRCWRCKRLAPTEELFAGLGLGGTRWAAPEGATRVAAAGNAFLLERHRSSSGVTEAHFWSQKFSFLDFFFLDSTRASRRLMIVQNIFEICVCLDTRTNVVFSKYILLMSNIEWMTTLAIELSQIG